MRLPTQCEIPEGNAGKINRPSQEADWSFSFRATVLGRHERSEVRLPVGGLQCHRHCIETVLGVKLQEPAAEVRSP